ncbi:MAG: tetratricopeptide repeat protein [Verrucomicrobiales bacterium]|jgi:tetratricopeptide (TPR) repeat protein|nr:tetratricopeptide repeat protein [Verrucomicrobiales bacterium]
MPETQPVQLTSQQLEIYRKAKEAGDRQNFDYAITLLRSIVSQTPGHLDSRRMLRANELLKFKASSIFSRKSAGLKVAPLQLKGKSVVKKSPQEAMEIAEDILAIDPTSNAGNELLAEAAEALELHDVAILAHETLRDANPKDLENLKTLGQIYLKINRLDQAQNVFQTALALSPNDGETLKMLKDSSAMQASQKGSWESGKDFRASLKDEKESVSYEQASKIVKSAEAIDEQIAALYAQFDQNNPSINVVIKIADLYERKDDLPTALQWFEYAYGLTNNSDPELDKRVYKLRTLLVEQGLVAKKAELAAATDENRAQLEQEYADLQQQQAEFRLKTARERVARYPNDKMFRYDLGKALIDAGLYKEAVPELQEAVKQPAVRYQAFNLLGVAFWKRKMLDFAIKQFQTAASEIPGMDELKKEIIYNLGCVLNESGKTEEALNQFKLIYEVDSQYRDVAERVESSYQ